MSKALWGDEDDPDYLPDKSITTDADTGVTTVVAYRFNSEKQKIRMVKKTKTTVRQTRTSKAAIERKKWVPFGAATNAKDNKTVTFSGEKVSIDRPGDMDSNKRDTQVEEAKDENLTGAFGTFWKKQQERKQQRLLGVTPEDEAGTQGPAAAGASGKYVPPSLARRLREGGTPGGGSMMPPDRENATLRVSNISSETKEADLHELFKIFGSIMRIYLAKHRDTNESRGFAYISYHNKEDAERARAELDGHGYDHLILKLEWAKPSNPDEKKEGGLSGGYTSGYGKQLAQDTTLKTQIVDQSAHNAASAGGPKWR